MDRQPRGIEQLVDAQVRLWMANQAAHAANVKAGGAAAVVAPPVTVSREFGAQGEQLARVVSERMGFSYWDTELLSEIASTARVPRQLLEGLDERRRSSVDRFVERWAPSGAPTDEAYLRELVRVIRTLGSQGSSVIVGRGSQFILGPGEALHVRVIAPLEQRVEGLVARRGWTAAEARAEVARMDEERVSFQRASFDRDPRDPHHYDLVLNLGHMTLERAATVIEAAWHAKFPRR